MTRGRGLAAWVKDLEEYALGAALAGRDIAGWKAVEGRGSRDWIEGQTPCSLSCRHGV